MYLNLVANIVLLLGLLTIYSVSIPLRASGKLWSKILMGLLFGGVTIVGMLLPLNYAPGIFYDGRSIILSLAGLFGGGVTTIVSILVAGIYRAYLGGNGIWAGLATILCSGILGLAFRHFYTSHSKNLGTPQLYIFGISVHIVMLTCQLLVQPWPIGVTIIKQIWLPILLIFPAATVLMGALLRNEDQRIQSREDLRKSEALYHDLVETSQDLIWQCDAEGRYTYLNPAWEGVFGYKIEDMLGKKFTDFQPPEYAEKDMEQFSLFLEGNTIKRVETIHIGKNDRKIHLVFSAKTIVDENGKLAGIRGTAYDITDRKKAEESLVEASNRWNTTFRSINDGIAIMDVNYRILQSNPAFQNLVGKTEQEIISKPCYYHLHGKDSPVDECPFVKAKRSKKRESLELRIRGKVMEVIIDPIFNTSGEITGAVHILSDITDRKQAEHALLEYQERLEREVLARTEELRAAQETMLQQERLATFGRLSGGVAHELRNPLGVISNAVYYLRLIQPKAENKVKDYLAILERESQAAVQIISDLLNFSTMQTGDRRPFVVAELIHRVITQHPEPEGITLKVSIPETISTIFVDPRQVEQALGRLVKNAYEAMAEGGTLTIIAKDASAQGKSFVTISVKDTGSGVSPENMPKLFEPLFTTKPRHIGLGLALSRRLIEVNGGGIEVKSKLGKGSIFTIHLPFTSEG